MLSIYIESISIGCSITYRNPSNLSWMDFIMSSTNIKNLDLSRDFTYLYYYQLFHDLDFNVLLWNMSIVGTPFESKCNLI